MSTRRKGFSHERDLVRRLWGHGFAVIRAPASGSKTKRIVYPDVVAIYKGRIVVMEVKTISEPRDIYVEKYKVNRLREFSHRAQAVPYIAVKVIGTGEWLLIPLERLVELDKSYKLPREAISKGIKIDAFISEMKGVKKLTEFMSERGPSPDL